MACQDPTVTPADEDTEEEISPLSGKKMRKHERWGLRGLAKEQHVEFWEQAIYWCRERFSEAKWREVVWRIERAAKEDNVIIFGWHPPQQPANSVTTQRGRQLLLHSSSSLTSPTGPHPLRPPHLPRIATSTPTTARPRWDVVTSGPVTPLSATLGPVKNAFAEGGVWASLSPKTPLSVASVASTPITAVLVEPWTPDAPRDVEAKDAYDEVRRTVRKMALQLCASRLGLCRSSDGGHDVIHPSMVKPKDELLASEVVLDSLRIDLSQHLDTTLPAKIEQFVDDEAACLRQYSIQTAEKLEDIDSWLQIDEKTGEMTNILEAQRGLLRLSRNCRKKQDIHISEKAVQCAWTTKILSDLEYIFDSQADTESVDSDEDQGYDYENFVRSLRSASRSIPGDAGAERVVSCEYFPSNTKIPGNDIEQDGQERKQQTRRSLFRSSSSPVKRILSSSIFPMGTQDFTASPSPPKRKTHTHAHGRNLSINTSSQLSSHLTPELSPEERFFRHQGPSMHDLDCWADELKRMERKRTEMKLDGTLHPALRCEAATSDMAFPSRGRRQGGGGRGMRNSTASTASTISWRCETASLIEDTMGAGNNTLQHEYFDHGDRDEEGKGDEATTTPRLDRHNARASLRLAPPRRPPHIPHEWQRDDCSLPSTADRRANRVVSLDRCVSRQSKEEEEEWVRELERMEKKEKMRQIEATGRM